MLPIVFPRNCVGHTGLILIVLLAYLFSLLNSVPTDLPLSCGIHLD